ALERDERALLARLQIEHPLAGRPDGPGGEVIGGDEFERRAHFPPRQTRSTPSACATAALIGSACDTATTTAPGCRVTMRASAEVTRVCISVKDSPPGKRNPEGWRWTTCHSGLR